MRFTAPSLRLQQTNGITVQVLSPGMSLHLPRAFDGSSRDEISARTLGNAVHTSPRNLSRLELLPEYRSDQDDPVNDFYIPCFLESRLYRRAVGYFTSQALALAGKGVATFLDRDGAVRLVASPILTPEDIEAIQQGYAARDEVVGRALLRPLLPLEEAVQKDRLSALAWLVAEGRVEIRVAIRCDAHGRVNGGIYHEKIGIFSDEFGNAVAFTGSSNETVGGLVSNFESFDVFCSWDDPTGRVRRKAANFDRLWSNGTPGLLVLDFPEAAKQRLLEFLSAERSSADPESRETTRTVGAPWVVQRTPRMPPGLEIREYQKEAIRAWLRNRGRGLFKMATGTGKTITALSLLTQLWESVLPASGKKLAVLIVCPYRHLVTQWAEECRSFNVAPLRCFESRAAWADELDADLLSFNCGTLDFLAVVTTNSTFATNAFQERLARIAGPLLVIADEVHNLGSGALQHRLPEHARFRLGLSATPERWFDEEGTESLLSYFGKVVFEFGLGQAIDSGALTPYDYHPVVVELTPEEGDEYLELSQKIAQRFGRPGDEKADDQGLKWLLLKRARLLANAHNKLDALRKVIGPLRDTTHNLFYCGDGQVEYDPGENELKQLEAVVRVLGGEFRMKVDSYTAETYLEQRDRLQGEFSRGDVQALVAIRCLDEGVDIPATRRAFILASSTNPKQFIQRRGRVLRRAPGKPVAEIYDFIVVPPPAAVDEAVFNVDRKLLRRELQRFVEFAELARNAGEASAMLLPLKKKYHLLDVGRSPGDTGDGRP